MMTGHMITGSIVALVTPMDADGQLDWLALDRLIEWHVASGTDALVAVGTTGESATLTLEEHSEVIAHAVKTVAGRMPVIAGTGANATQEAIDLSQEAKRVGADACLSVTPYYNKPTQEGLYLHYRRIAEQVDIPHILYNVPSRTACDLLPETVARLSGIPNIIGIKDATGSLARGRDLLEQCPPDFLLYSGDDATAADLILMGARGNISVTANIAPVQMAQVCRAALAGDRAQAVSLNEQIALLHQRLFVEANPIPVKWALHVMGLIDTGIRLPLTPLSEAKRADLLAALQQVGILS